MPESDEREYLDDLFVSAVRNFSDQQMPSEDCSGHYFEAELDKEDYRQSSAICRKDPAERKEFATGARFGPKRLTLRASLPRQDYPHPMPMTSLRTAPWKSPADSVRCRWHSAWLLRPRLSVRILC